MKYCTACGTECDEHAAYCSGCGADLSAQDIPPLKPIYKRFFFWPLILLFTYYVSRVIVGLSYGMPVDLLADDLCITAVHLVILTIESVVIHIVSEKTSAKKRASARRVANCLYFVILIWLCIIVLCMSNVTTYDPAYTEESYFSENYMEASMAEVRYRVEEEGYRVVGFTAPEYWQYKVTDSGDYKAIFVVQIEKGLSNYKYMCTLTFKFSGYKHFYLTDAEFSPYLLW